MRQCGIENDSNSPKHPSNRGYDDYDPFLSMSEYTVWLVFVTLYLL
jgi:hypothetical protein